MSEVLYCPKCAQGKHWTQFYGIKRLSRFCGSCEAKRQREYQRKRFTPAKKLRMVKHFNREWGEICIF